MEDIIKVQHLKKYFKGVRAVNDVSFNVKSGELFGFLGVNGAGKSTVINMMCTLFKPTSGDIEICGYKVGKDDAEIRKEIGVVWQNNCLDGRLTVKENICVRSALYDMEEKVDKVCEIMELTEVWNRRYKDLSGGQKRRCEIAAALVNSPKILFLDEPTTGLDPATRKIVWNNINRLRKENKVTVFLTTHYMEEANEADRIVIIDAGRIKAQGTPFELKEKYTTDVLRIITRMERNKEFEDYLVKKNGEYKYKRKDNIYEIDINKSTDAIELLYVMKDSIEGFEMMNGTLDDAFLNITGKVVNDYE
ncbi:ABC transporter ATP-binding protein [Falcatimonas sp. MSJ-15]|uniref:ABC transporter ATP-binding protein n=1 Tax=Falcatimonas sp. MSJ-15 TaxID=2841515 RepID=UPI001C115AD8|nr:ABC transporter ATP-binding protein [Falcatimonas sp. MSJ-15]MBU5470053.1 ABC transporter ATP-binding protein [Falcatimonas sp. MSJ-15]